jgi:hypothetical protein
VKRFLDKSFFSAEVVMGENSENLLRFSEMHIGGIDPGSQVSTSVPGFKGSLQQLTFNGEDIFELARSGQLSNHQVRVSTIQ